MASRPPNEQQVILDADGRPVLNAMDAIAQRIATIQKQIKEISKDSFKGADDFQKSLSQTVNNLRQAMGDLKTLQTAAGTNIQALNNNRGLARATVQAGDYARSLGMARTSVEALQGRINDLNREIAGRGANGQAATVAQRDRLEMYQRQLAALRQLETQFERTDRRAARSKGGDFSAEVRALQDAQSRLQAAALNPRRVNFDKELRSAQLAQDAYTEAVNRSRTALAALAREQRSVHASERATARIGVRNEVFNQGANARTIAIEGQAEQFRIAKQLAAAEGQQRTELMRALEIAKARTLEAEKLVRAEEAAAAAVARGNAAAQRRNAADEAARARLLGVSRKDLAVSEASQLRTLDALEKARNQNASRLNQLRAELKAHLNGEVRLTNEKLRQINTEIALERAVGNQIRQNLRDLERGTKEIEKQNAARAKAAAAEQNRGFLGGRFGLPEGGLGTVFARTAAYGLAGAAIFQTISAIKEAISFTIQWEDKLAQLSAIANATQPEMMKLQESIAGVGANSRYTLIELTEMATKLAQAGVSVGQMGEVLDAVSRLAAASGSTTQESVDLVTAALGSFQLQASEAARVADFMVTALNRTRLTVQQAQLAIQYVGATAFEQNMTLEQLMSTTAALSQAGIRSGSTIGTGMRQFMVDLAKPSQDLQEQLERLGLTLRDVDVTTQGLPKVLENLDRAGFGAAQAYGNLETRAAAFYLVARNNTDLMRELQVSFAESGAAMTASERSMDSLSAQWTRFTNLAGAAFEKSFRPVRNFLKDLFEFMSDSMERSAAEWEEYYERNRSGANGWLGQLNQGIDDFFNGTMNALGEVAMFFSRGILNVLDGNWWANGFQNGAGDQFDAWVRGGQRMSDVLEEVTARFNEQQEEVNKTSDTINALDREIQRLITQQEMLNSTQGAVTAETITLMGRFEGLSGQINTTITDVNGLTTALNNLRNQQAGLLMEQIIANVSTAREQITAGQGTRAEAITAFKGTTAWGNLTPGEQALFDQLDSDDAQVRARALAEISRLEQHFGRTNQIGAERALRRVITAQGGISQARGAIVAGEARLGDLRAQETPIGRQVRQEFAQIDGIIAQLRTASDREKPALTARAIEILDRYERELRPRLNRQFEDPANRRFLEQTLERAGGYRRSLTDATTPTNDERRRTEAEQQREQARREREQRDRNQPLVTQQDLLRIFRDTFAPTPRRGGSFLSPQQRINSIVTAGDELIRMGLRVGENRHISGSNGRRTTPTFRQSAHTSQTHGDFAIDVNAVAGIDYNDPVARARLEQVARTYQARGYRILWRGHFWEPYGNGPGGTIAAANARRRARGQRQIGDHMDHLHMEGQKTNPSGGSGPVAAIPSDMSIGNVTEEEGNRRARQFEQSLRSRGITGANVSYANGRLSVALPEGARWAANADRDGTRYEEEQERRQLRNEIAIARMNTDTAESDLREKIRDLRYGLTRDAMVEAEGAVNDSFEEWEEALRAQAHIELDQRNATEGEAEAYMAEISDRIDQRREELNTAIFEGILKSISNQMQLIEEDFNRQLRGAQGRIQVAEATLTGFGYFSNAGRIPDYVQNLAQGRQARAQEDLARARLAALPNRISREQSTLAQLNLDMETRMLDEGQKAKLQEQIDEITASIHALRLEKEALDASFAAGGLVPTSLSEGLDQAIASYREAHVLTRNFKEEMIFSLGGAIENVHTGLTTMFTDIITGSKSVLAAMGDFVMGMINYMQQLAARALANQIFSLLLNALGSAAGAGFAGPSAPGAGGNIGGFDIGNFDSVGPGGSLGGIFGFTGMTNINGVPYDGQGRAQLIKGGRVMNGSSQKDSVNARIARDEWVVQGPAVRSVGHEFMANLNAHGARALDAMRAAPVLVAPHQETNVFLVKPDIPRQMGKNDILVAIQEDALQNGETTRLLRKVVQN